MIYKPLSMAPDNEYYGYGQPITFTWKNSGDIMYAYRIYAYEITTNTLKYDSGEITSYTASHTPSSNLAINNYKWQVVVYNANASVTTRSSATSDFKVFHVVAVPTVTLNLGQDDTIANQSLSISATYSHPNGIKQKQYRFILYDENQNAIEYGDYLTSSDFEYTFKYQLANNTNYYVNIELTTYDNIFVQTPLIRFKAVYIQPSVNFDLKVETYKNEPYAYINWTVKRIIGTLSGNGFYVDSNNNTVSEDKLATDATKINLLADGSKVYFDTGFTITDDFTLNLWVEHITENTEFFKLSSMVGQIHLIYYDNRVHVIKEINGFPLVHGISKIINYTGTEQIMVQLQQDGKRVGVKAVIV